MWKDVAGYEGHYLINEDGDVFSVKSGKILKARRDRRDGFIPYLMVTLCVAGTKKGRLVHRLLLEAFVSAPPSSKHQAAHSDGDYKNIALSNLRWALPTENRHDMIRHGKLPKGITHGRAKLTEADVLSIRRRIKDGCSGRGLAREYGVEQTTICHIAHRRSWKHLEDAG